MNSTPAITSAVCSTLSPISTVAGDDGKGADSRMIDDGTHLIPLLLDAEASARLLGIGRSLFYALHSSGRLGPMPVRLGKRSLWRRDEIESWVAADCPARQQWQTMKDAS